MVLFKTRISCFWCAPGPRCSVFISYLFFICISSHIRESSGPVMVKSSPCTDRYSSRTLCQKLQVLAAPDTNPIDTR